MAKVIAWTDVESAGTAVELDSLLEVAVVLTDLSGEPIGEGYSSLVAVKDLSKVRDRADSVAREMHDRSGLWDDLWTMEAKEPSLIDRELCSFLFDTVEAGEVIYFGGNSPILDRRYAELYLPHFYKQISHRTVDVTTLSLVLQEHGDAPMFHKRGEHRALSDVYDSIEEYRHYLQWIAA